jgi:hypothetical protein
VLEAANAAPTAAGCLPKCAYFGRRARHACCVQILIASFQDLIGNLPAPPPGRPRLRAVFSSLLLASAAYLRSSSTSTRRRALMYMYLLTGGALVQATPASWCFSDASLPVFFSFDLTKEDATRPFAVARGRARCTVSGTAKAHATRARQNKQAREEEKEKFPIAFREARRRRSSFLLSPRSSPSSTSRVASIAGLHSDIEGAPRHLVAP